MTYSTFAADVLCHGATMAKWLSRLTLRTRAQEVAA